MAARFRKVDPRIWGDAKFRALTDDGKLLFLYLITGLEVTSLPGLVVIGRMALAETLGWSLDRLDAAWCGEETELGRSVEKSGMARADWPARVVFIPNAGKYQAPENPNVVRSWRGHFDLVPDSDLKADCLRALSTFLGAFTEPFRKAFRDAFGTLLEDLPQTLSEGPPRARATPAPHTRASRAPLEPEPEPEPECVATPETALPRPVPPESPPSAVQPIALTTSVEVATRDALTREAGDITRLVEPHQVDAVARRIVGTVSAELRCPKNSAPLYVPEAVRYARGFAADKPHATPMRVLAEVEKKVGMMVGDVSSRKREPLKFSVTTASSEKKPVLEKF